MKKVRVLMGIMTILVAGMLGAVPTHAQFYFMENPLIGQEAPDFTLESLSGEKINFKEYRGDKKAIIFFWATWCPHCRKQIKALKEAGPVIQKKGIRMLLVDEGEKPAVVKDFLRSRPLVFPVLLDTQSKLSDVYNVIGLPTFVFVDEKGMVAQITHSLPDDYEKAFR